MFNGQPTEELANLRRRWGNGDAVDVVIVNDSHRTAELVLINVESTPECEFSLTPNCAKLVTKVSGYKANRIFMIMEGIQLVLLIAVLLCFTCCLTDPLCVIIGAALVGRRH
jgi:hypothetical protein